MKISKTERHIKKHLAESNITPSQNMWDSIEQELDKTSKPKNNRGWLKYAGIAAVFCVGFLVYQLSQPNIGVPSLIVLDSKPIIENEIQLSTTPVDYVAVPLPIKKEIKLKVEPETYQAPKQFEKTAADNKIVTLDSETDILLSQAQTALAEAEKEKELLNEVNSLLADAVKQTQDEDQKQILQNMQATILLAEAEADIELQKPPNLKTKIWDALVSNFNDFKDTVVLN